MRELEIEFVGKGEVKDYTFKQVLFQNDWYVYSVTLPEQSEPSHFEVFKRKEVKALPPFAPEDYVQYPKANSFGVRAWTTKTLDKAKEIIERKTAIELMKD